MQNELTEQVKKAMTGDVEAFQQLMAMKARQIIYIAVKLAGDQSVGEALAQEAMLTMYQRIGELQDPEAFPVWMYQILNRICQNRNRNS